MSGSQTLSLDPNTGLPYPQNYFQVADGIGTRVWQDVFTTISSQSGLDGAPIGYLPSSIYQSAVDISSLSSVVTANYVELSTSIGNGGIPGSITSAQLVSTVTWITVDAQYVDAIQLNSTAVGIQDGALSIGGALASTTAGLGSAGYVSTATLYSTVGGIESDLVSTVGGLGSIGYISTGRLTSTVAGLATAGYISSSQLQSTLNSLLYLSSFSGGHYGVVVTGELYAPFQNFTTLTSNYFSTVRAFTFDNAGFYGVVFGSNLPSTVAGLGSAGYVSTSGLVSTTAGILASTQNVYVDQTNNLFIRDSQVFMSSVNAIIFLSSFVNSTMTYQGNQGLITGAAVNDSNFYFSTATVRFDRFSTSITPSSIITLDVYPNMMFPPITAGVLRTYTYTMSSFIQYGANIVSPIHNTRIYGTSHDDNMSNVFQQPLRFTMVGSTMMGNYSQPYTLSHYVPGGLSYNLNKGFRDPVVDLYFGSTNSLFLTVQNLPF